MQSKLRNYPDWKAPSADGELVIWPEPPELLRETHENSKRLSSADQVKLQNIPLPQVRQRMREFVGHTHVQQPLIAMGHQTEMYHAGVWAKNALINSASAALDGQAFQIAVDTDAPKHLNVRWPPNESIPITDDSALTSAAWSGLLASPSPAHVNSILERLDAVSAAWNFKPALPEVLISLRRLALESVDLSNALTNAIHALDWSLGLKQHVLLASPIWGSEPFLLFVYDLLARADETTAQYNRALADHRKAAGIRSNTRPMPDLVLSDLAVEIPFWLDDLQSGRRIRPSLFRTDHGWILQQISGEEFVFERGIEGWEGASRLQRWLNSARHRISPRALTLTMFIRLLLADQFVHGIGGARYDLVTDRLIASCYGIEPPAFAVTTATLYFPEALSRKRVCVPCVHQEGHRLKHGLLGARKREYVEQIAALPQGSPQRSSRFFEMHAQLAAAATKSDTMNRWQERLQQTEVQEREEQALFDRELFYAMQPHERLRETIERYQVRLNGKIA